MNLWATLGISPHVGMVVAAAGVVTAVVIAGLLLRRRTAGGARGLGLVEHR
ncbi:MAG: hypothetical protein U0599_10800 [Vicinamibacteria bacterium]